jgi:hypothetical protein
MWWHWWHTFSSLCCSHCLTPTELTQAIMFPLLQALLWAGVLLWFNDDIGKELRCRYLHVHVTCRMCMHVM